MKEDLHEHSLLTMVSPGVVVLFVWLECMIINRVLMCFFTRLWVCLLILKVRRGFNSMNLHFFRLTSVPLWEKILLCILDLSV